MGGLSLVASPHSVSPSRQSMLGPFTKTSSASTHHSPPRHDPRLQAGHKNPAVAILNNGKAREPALVYPHRTLAWTSVSLFPAPHYKSGDNEGEDEEAIFLAHEAG